MRQFLCATCLSVLVMSNVLAAEKTDFAGKSNNFWLSGFVGGAIAIPLVTYLYINYHELAWYFSYVMYSGKQASPAIARKITQYLDSYIRCMEMMSDIQKQLDATIQKAEKSVIGSGKEQTIRLVRASIAAVFERELADAQRYCDQTRERLGKLELTDVCTTYSPRGGKVLYKIDLSSLRQFESRSLSRVEIQTLDNLVKNILEYWHAYLTSLALAIDKQIALCKQVHALERFVSTVLNRPLLPAFE